MATVAEYNSHTMYSGSPDATLLIGDVKPTFKLLLPVAHVEPQQICAWTTGCHSWPPCVGLDSLTSALQPTTAVQSGALSCHALCCVAANASWRLATLLLP